MFTRFIRSTLFLFLVFNLQAYCSPVDLSHITYVKHKDKPAHVTSVSKKGNNSVIEMLLNQGSAAQVTSQNYKPVHFIKLVIIFNQNVFPSISCLKHISGGSIGGFSRFRKLILFPFHAFW